MMQEASCALDGLQALFANLEDVPIQRRTLSGVGVLVGLVREKVDGANGELETTQGHWVDEWREKSRAAANY